MTNSGDRHGSGDSSGNVGPFDSPDSGRLWLASRTDVLATRVGQAPIGSRIRTALHLPAPWHGISTSDAVSYRVFADVIELVVDFESTKELDSMAVDGMLLHALGRRAQRNQFRFLYAAAAILAALGCALALVAAFSQDSTAVLTVAAGLWVVSALGLVGLFLGATHRLATAADDFALTHGGVRPILKYLRRSESETRLKRIQRRIWADSTLDDTEEPVTDQR